MVQNKIQNLENQIAELEAQTKDIDLHLSKVEQLSNDTKQTMIHPNKEKMYWSEPTMLTMSLSILGFGVVIIFLISYLISKGKDSELLVKAFGIPLIIVAAVFLVIAGYTEAQIAPVIGLLGTIAGYLLGKKSDTQLTQKDTKSSNQNEKV